MSDVALPWSTLLAVGLACGSCAALLSLRRKSDAEVLFAVFCGSLALSMLRPWIGTDSGALWWVVAIGSAATCNAYWLVARALFRGDRAVGVPHAAVAFGVAALIVLWRLLDPAQVAPPLHAVLGALLEFAGAAVLVLALVEALRGYGPGLSAGERRLRIGFVLVFGGCVMAGTIAKGLADTVADAAAMKPTIVSFCALSIVLYTLLALTVRRRQRGLAAESIVAVEASASVEADTASAATPEDHALAAAILRLIEVDAVHLDPELKVADLARRLDSAEHRISRAITQGLGERNFNRLINRHRIEHACRLLDQAASMSVLEISAAAGFASLGPFNRAFKEATGLTPTAYRRRQHSELQRPRLSDPADAPAP
ncbi:MAG: helix-turn-helix domain-containing protein [Xanthomonadales bacterium]|jgi:AraC-like DNA-binding protein|nr:helix-turn-helix domain-containing protein [Xanthomonadales bacterium]